jgi:hypothetical protein
MEPCTLRHTHPATDDFDARSGKCKRQITPPARVGSWGEASQPILGNRAPVAIPASQPSYEESHSRIAANQGQFRPREYPAIRKGPAVAARSRASKVRSLPPKPAKITAWLNGPVPIAVFSASSGDLSARKHSQESPDLGAWRHSPIESCCEDLDSVADALNVPNPCTACHMDRTAKWANGVLKTRANLWPWRIVNE